MSYRHNFLVLFVCCFFLAGICDTKQSFDTGTVKGQKYFYKNIFPYVVIYLFTRKVILSVLTGQA